MSNIKIAKGTLLTLKKDIDFMNKVAGDTAIIQQIKHDLIYFYFPDNPRVLNVNTGDFNTYFSIANQIYSLKYI